MTKKEKIIAICFTISYILVIASCVFTLYQNKPKDHCFVIEKVFKNF